MKQKFFGSRYNAVSTSATNYTSLMGPSYISTTEGSNVVACTGTLRNLYVLLDSDPDSGGSGNGYRFRVRYASGNGTLGDTNLYVDVLSSTSNFRNSNTSDTVSITAGDKVSLAVERVGTPANAPNFTFVIEFEGTTSTESMYCGRTASGTLGTGDTTYIPIAMQGSSHATEYRTSMIMPCAGTITQLYIRLATAPGSGKTRTFRVRVNEATPTGYADVSFANTSGINNAAQNIDVAAGDRIDILMTMTQGSTPTASSYSGSIVFQPDTAGEFAIPYGCNALAANYLLGANNQYFPVHAGNAEGTVGEVDQGTIFTDDFTVKQACAWISPAPGSSPAKYTLKLRKDAADCSTPFTVTFDDNTQGPKYSSSGSYTPTLWSQYDTLGDPDNTPADAYLLHSYLGYIASGESTPVTGTPSDNMGKYYTLVQSG